MDGWNFVLNTKDESRIHDGIQQEKSNLMVIQSPINQYKKKVFARKHVFHACENVAMTDRYVQIRAHARI